MTKPLVLPSTRRKRTLRPPPPDWGEGWNIPLYERGYPRCRSCGEELGVNMTRRTKKVKVKCWRCGVANTLYPPKRK